MMSSSPHATHVSSLTRSAVTAALFFGITTGCADVVGHPVVRTELGSGTGGNTGTGGATSVDSSTGIAGNPRALNLGGFGSIPFPTVGDPSIPQTGGVPTTEYCSAVYSWPAGDSHLEATFLDSLNALRSSGGVCGTGSGTATMPPLMMSEELRCAARSHSLDMVNRGYRSEIDPSGLTPIARVSLAGYSALDADEVIAEAPSGAWPYMVLEQLIGSNGADCAALFDPTWVDVGVGLTQGVWTIDLARPN